MNQPRDMVRDHQAVVRNDPPRTIPLDILTGFLGAGKTTRLHRILNSAHGLRVALLNNDFGAINIDSDLVVVIENHGTGIGLANGNLPGLDVMGELSPSRQLQYKIRGGRYFVDEAETPFEVPDYRIGDKHLAARSNEFG